MKVLISFLVLLISAVCYAEQITLTTPQPVVAPSAVKISDWEITRINAERKLLSVRYRWRDATGDVIDFKSKDGWHTWTCQDIEVQGTNAECIEAGNPYPCCTDAGAGTCDGMVDTCFSDVFGFTIRSQDVGVKMGVGLRTLIWNKMKTDIIPGNDGAFD
jgi:hypothetical protein